MTLPIAAVGLQPFPESGVPGPISCIPLQHLAGGLPGGAQYILLQPVAFNPETAHQMSQSVSLSNLSVSASVDSGYDACFDGGESNELEDLIDLSSPGDDSTLTPAPREPPPPAADDQFVEFAASALGVSLEQLQNSPCWRQMELQDMYAQALKEGRLGKQQTNKNSKARPVVNRLPLETLARPPRLTSRAAYQGVRPFAA
ncbi:unnamed protein product [Vitrella brassicaformis CCMP3155]|uniref:Uncharacterized protein n=1 Tax=Vitrella brassicaformis (strain CCMP3155) TaxID=1169540 RepID=A0A0G4EG34_VITBC|nr:unnamed protein product [Vitrella brassicaformis CCMP3155]|eukprot:CEL94445.1 unnamed protein product [Vitrella brassicaformis CCMP3155]